MKFKPMLAEDCGDIENITYPAYASIKIDGIRCLMLDGQATSRSIKPIPNEHIRSELAKLGLQHFDGELLVGDKFHEATSGIMSRDGTPDFRYYVFDHFQYPEVGYLDRLAFLQILPSDARIIPLYPVECENRAELEAFLEKALAEGHEGVMVRNAHGPYKFGRATVREGFLLKLKPMATDEAVVTGFYEQEMNLNEATINALGHTERSSHKDGKVGKDTLGGLVVVHRVYGEFHLSTGFTDAQRREVWANQERYLGKLAHFKYQKHGTKDKPRIPTWLGWRNPEDLS